MDAATFARRYLAEVHRHPVGATCEAVIAWLLLWIGRA